MGTTKYLNDRKDMDSNSVSSLRNLNVIYKLTQLTLVWAELNRLDVPAIHIGANGCFREIDFLGDVCSTLLLIWR